MAIAFKMKGNLNKVLKTIEKDNIKMLKTSLREAAKLVKKKAKENSPVVTGTFKKDIRHSVRGRTRTGQAESQVGIHKKGGSMLYAKKVEKQHRIFRHLEKTEQKPVTNLFALKIADYWKKRRIKS